MESLKQAELVIGVAKIAGVCGVSYQAAKKWTLKGKLPRTDYTGETDYAGRIAAACKSADPESEITREALLGISEVTHHDRHDSHDSHGLEDRHGLQDRRAGKAA